MRMPLIRYVSWALVLLPVVLVASQATHREIHVWWKPTNASSPALDVKNMREQLQATDVIIYCGMAILSNGSVGAQPDKPGSRPGSGGWGRPDLCPGAIEAATAAGLGVQVILEGRSSGAYSGGLGPALTRGGAAIGEEALRFLGVLDPKGSVKGINIDWEPGKAGTWRPNDQQLTSFTAAFSAVLRRASLGLTLCFPGISGATIRVALTTGGMSHVFDMATYHGTSSNMSHHDWDWKLKFGFSESGNASVAQVGFVAGLMAHPTPNTARSSAQWENSTTSVVHKFNTLRALQLTKIALFCWPGFFAGVWPGLADEWRAQLKAFAAREEMLK